MVTHNHNHDHTIPKRGHAAPFGPPATFSKEVENRLFDQYMERMLETNDRENLGLSFNDICHQWDTYFRDQFVARYLKGQHAPFESSA